jgi:hypothetical protein
MTTITTPPAPAPARGPSHSANWSGYAVLSGSTPVTDVGARWTVPTLNCSARRDGGVGIWVGIGGIEGRSGPLLQTGVDLNCGNGVQFDNAFFEEVPPTTRNQTYGFANFPIAAGDSISASVYRETNGNWVTRLDDLTTGRSGWMVSGEAWGVGRDGASTFTNRGPTTKLTYSGGYSAEWIVEAHQLGGITSPLANYGTVNFTNLTTSLSPWHLTPDEQVQMVQNGTTLSTPSASSNNGFSVNYMR